MAVSFAFQDFELRAASRLLLHFGQPVEVGSRAFDLLVTLIERRDKVVRKAELLELVWPGLVVEENNLSVQISTLRRLLGAASIVTVAGRGYRFCAPVTEVDATSPDKPPLAPFDPSAWPGDPVRMLYADQPVVAAVAVRETGLADRPAAADLFGVWARLVASHGGKCLGPTTTELFAEFSDARAATRFAFALTRLAARETYRTLYFDGIALVSQSARLLAPAPAGEDGFEAKGAPSEPSLNFAARLARSAVAGEIRAVASVRDRLTDQLSCSVEDLGDLALPPGLSTVRVYRLYEPTDWHVDRFRALRSDDPRLVIAVIPFESRDAGVQTLCIGELIADGLIAALSNSRHMWRVISRLSSTAFRDRFKSGNEVQRHLRPTYAVGGSYLETHGRLLVNFELIQSERGELVASRRLTGTIDDLLKANSELVVEMIGEISLSIIDIQLKRVQKETVSTLESYSLLIGGIQMLHRAAPRDFHLSYRLFEQLAKWHPNATEPHVWMAKWHAMRAVQGLSSDNLADAKAALQCSGKALRIDPGDSLALAIEGFVHIHLTRDYEAAGDRLQNAIAQNPSETFAHLFNGVVEGIGGRFESGIDACETAARTSPRDPARYLMDSVASYLYLGSGKLESAVRFAKESLRQNRNHAHSWRILTIAQQELGEFAAARDSLQHVLVLQPQLTVENYLRGGRVGDAVRHRFATGLNGAGLPLR